jgi:formylglycine-generating enzyme required for sulfatase activity
MNQQLSHFIFVSIFATVLFCGCKKEDSPVSTANNPPAAPSSPSPSNGATGQSTSPTLSWSCSDPDGDALTYDVNFGTSSNPTTTIATNQTALSIARSGLTASTTYYWKIVAKDSKGATTTGSVWSFTTGSGVISQGMVTVAGGTFTAGSTLVTISSFKIDKYEVTYELWADVRTWALTHGYTDLVAGQNGYSPSGTNNPVTTVNWYDIVKWCNARSEKDGLTPVYCTDNTQGTIYRTGQIDINLDAVKWTANGYRLPTEAEWEFAARGGTSSQGYTYSGSNTIDNVAWYYSNSGTTTHTVGTKSANELGIYDMSGNVWEWCWDWYGSTYPSGGTSDPKGPSTTQTSRLLRGGSFVNDESYCRVGLRSGLDPDGRYGYGFGFRCAQD